MPMAWISKIRLFVALLMLSAFVAGCDLSLNPSSLPTQVVSLSLGQSNISFDELTFDGTLNRVIVPAAETGALALVDPQTGQSTIFEGFSAQTDPANRVIGTTSATTGRGVV